MPGDGIVLTYTVDNQTMWTASDLTVVLRRHMKVCTYTYLHEHILILRNLGTYQVGK